MTLREISLGSMHSRAPLGDDKVFESESHEISLYHIAKVSKLTRLGQEVLLRKEGSAHLPQNLNATPHSKSWRD
jgi:hypothetical protein